MPEHYDASEAVAEGVDRADGYEVDETTEKLVKRALEEHETAGKFDAPAYRNFRIDRTYAAGRADLTWASDANLIGSFIDVLKSFLYARDPDMDCRPAKRVPLPALASPLMGMAQPPQDPNEIDADAFAKTISIVVSRLWKDGRLKKAVKKQLGSTLSVGPGWIKAVILPTTERSPQIEKDLNDAQDNLRRLRAKEAEIAGGEVEDTEVAQRELEQIIAGLEANVEVIVRAGMAIDFVRAEDIQVSLDVAEITDYLDADWVDHSIFVPKTDLRKRFPVLTDLDVKKATTYYQKRPFVQDKESEIGHANDTSGDHSTFTKTQPSDSVGGDKLVEFARIIERWDKRDNLIKTMVAGVCKWAVDPYPPPQASSRFYPFFLLALYEVDNERFPQSLAWRLRKLQDEYSTTRSNYRRVRERTQPGTIFNKSAITPESMRALTDSVGAEFVGVEMVNPQADMNTIFAPKPTSSVNHNLYDTTPILADMERISGVQEALQSTVTTAKTATEANLQQAGFASRTNANRDVIEDMLRDLAQYTTEVALQTVPPEQAAKFAGPGAFWPFGMEVEDLLTLVTVDIDAGSTGKPNNERERETWSIVMPMIQQMLVEIRMLQTTDPGLAAAMIELLKETLSRLDDRFDVDKLIPSGAPPAMPGLPPPPGPGTAGGAPDLPPGAGGPPPVEPPLPADVGVP